MATPYDNHDPGYSRKERRIAADYGVDLDAPEQKKCAHCFMPVDVDQLDRRGVCGVCRADEKLEDALAFLTAPTLAGCLGLMGGR